MNLADSHIEAALVNGGQHLVKCPPTSRKSFHAMISFPGGMGALGHLQPTPGAALEDLETKLAREAGAQEDGK